MAQPTMPTASIPQATTSAFRSPIREATAPAGQVGGQLGDPDQREQEGGDADLGAERPRGEDDDRQDGAGPDRAECSRSVGRERDAAQAPDGLDHLVTLRRPPDVSPTRPEVRVNRCAAGVPGLPSKDTRKEVVR